MKFKLKSIIIVLSLVLMCISVSAVFADWLYFDKPLEVVSKVQTTISNFKYGLFYITNIKIINDNHNNASIVKTGDTTVNADMELTASSNSTVEVEVTFFNNTNVTYYYDETVTLTSNNSNINYTVTNIVEAEEVISKAYKTVKIIFGYTNAADLSATTLLSDLNFKFTVDKSSIEDIVAETAIDRFSDILNNIVAEDSYDVLIDAMDNRSGINKGSAITYIGNVAGADSGDSATINELFGEEFMSMDLDGDGNSEPITMLIKRENLDNDTTTGGSYTYTSWNRETTVNGVEMTIYITAQDFSNVSSGNSITVYAATFTKPLNSAEWINLLPLTKGTAPANNYSGGWGGANSFNTDDWVSEQGYDIKTLI